MTKLQEAAQQALKVLERADNISGYGNNRKAIAALRAALAEDAMQRLTDEQQMIERGTKAWADVPDATAWVDEMRGNIPAPTGQESRQVEPVAYVTGYFDGKCVIKPIESVVLPAGMALYRSPPTSQESRQVEPVAWLIEAYDIYEKCTLQRLVFDKPKNMQGVKITAYYIAPPKREPLTEEEMWEVIGSLADTRLAGPLEKLIRATERAHGIGGEE